VLLPLLIAVALSGAYRICLAADPVLNTGSDQPEFQDLSQIRWETMLPDLGESCPEIAILHVDPHFACDPALDPHTKSASHP